MTWACGYGCPALALLALCTAWKLSGGGWTRFICTRLGAARITLTWLQLRAGQILAGGCVPPHYVWVGGSGKIVIIWGNLNTPGSDPPDTLHASVTAWKMLFLCDTALGPDLGSRRCPILPLWVSQDVFFLGPLGRMRWRAAVLWHAAVSQQL